MYNTAGINELKSHYELGFTLGYLGAPQIGRVMPILNAEHLHAAVELFELFDGAECDAAHAAQMPEEE